MEPETLCNDTDKISKPVRNFYYNGIDRVDNLKGYTRNNCIPCCSICNQSKHTMSKKDWLQWITRVYTFQKG